MVLPLALVLAFPSVAAEPSERPPDVLLIVADDLTWSDLGCTGSPDVRTPNLDALADQGMVLSTCYAGAPMCAPARAQLYTGLYPVRNGCYPNHGHVREGVRSLPHWLGEAGYRVGIAGKTHFGPADAFPFERIGKGRGSLRPLREAAREFLARDAEQPACLVYASHEPHTPWDKGDASAYDPAELTLPPTWVDTPEARSARARYLAEIEWLDGEVGGLLEVLDEVGRAERTLVLFLTEQGAGAPFAKWTCYEAGLRATGIVRWPGQIDAGSRSNAMVHYVDVVPTLLEAAGASAPDGLDGRSFLGLLTGEREAHRDHLFGLQTSRGISNGPPAFGIRSVRDDRFKLVVNLSPEAEFTNNVTVDDSGGIFHSWIERAREEPAAAARVAAYRRRPAVELFDLARDPHELENLAGREEHAAVEARLAEVLEAWMAQQGDRGHETEMKAEEHLSPNRRKRFEKAGG